MPASLSKKIPTSKELAQRLARLARQLRDAIKELAAQKQFSAVKPAEFADTYAQTIVYGMFAARFLVARGAKYSLLDAAALAKTDPLLQKLFQAIASPDIDQRIARLVDECAGLLEQTAVHGFKKTTPGDDPVLYFYETFLEHFDPALRTQRGVYYTPQPIVDWMVRSVHELLISHFKKPLGMADNQTIILDPATGTATFLCSAIKQIHETITGQGDESNPDGHNLMNRLFAYESLMAPYGVAHLKTSLLLSQLNYKPKPEQRLGIYLANALTDNRNISFTDESVLVVLGNPPYSKKSSNRGKGLEKIEKFMERYKTTIKNEEIQIQALSNDYVKFIAFAHEQIEKAGKGIIAYITDNGYLDGPLFRDLRSDLLQSFTDIFILNLHGNLRKREDKAGNVFEIKQGVAIMLLVLNPEKNRSHEIHYHSLTGTREAKYRCLDFTSIQTIAWQKLSPTTPRYLFLPTRGEFSEEWKDGFSIAHIFGGRSRKTGKLAFFGAGFATRHDRFAIAFSEPELLDHVAALTRTSATEHELREKFRLCTTRHWSFDRARAGLNIDYARSKTISVLYRPFDLRFTIYSPLVIGEMRKSVMSHMLEPNLALVTTRRSTGRPFDNFFISDRPVEYKAGSHDRNAQVFPLYLYSEDCRQPNINPAFVSDAEQCLGMKFIGSGSGDLKTTFGPEDILHYAYSIFHCPTYRKRYAEFLNLDFPRLPVTRNKKLFAELVARGARLVDLHLLRPPGSKGVGGAGGAHAMAQPEKHGIKFRGSGDNKIKRVTYVESTGRVNINDGQFFEGINRSIWEMEICGYRPAKDWLNDRRRRRLVADDIQHYTRIIIALRETERIMKQIERSINRWPLK
ncbi:MAG: type ISP restriction/modification enzyme [Blastocatellia bacterium]